MSNTTAQAKPFSQFELTLSRFDFNLEDMRFISNQFASARGAVVTKLADALRWWGTERSANPRVDVTYQINGLKRDGKMVNGVEYIYFSEADAEEKALVSVLLGTGPTTNEVFENSTDPLAALALYDANLAAVKSSLGDPYLSAYVSLRHQVATAARMAKAAQVQESSIAFQIEDGDMTHTFKVVVSHFRLAGSPAQAEPVPVG